MKTRRIGIVHRTKRTKDNEARPTMVFIQDLASGKGREYKLETEDGELDFLLGKYPTKWRDAKADENLSIFFKRHHLDRKIKDGENPDGLMVIEVPGKRKGEVERRVQIVPATYDGLQSGDAVAMILGGSGDRFAYALSHRGEEIEAKVYRLPAAILKDRRGERNKDSDHKLLVEIFEREPDIFYEAGIRDRKLIRLVEVYRDRMEAMRERIACEQRLRQRHIGKVFLSETGHYPEGLIEDEFDALKASDPILQALLDEENKCNKALVKAVTAMDVWPLFENIEGVGPAIAARIIVAIGDIRRFSTDAKLKAFLGAHVMQGGKYGEQPANKQFVRRRAGQVANWHPDGRQALYLLGDQFNRRKDSVWGKKFLDYKRKLRDKHPEMVDPETKKKRYGDGHIHKMATWRTLTKFVEWLWREWWKIENELAKAQSEPKAA